MSSSAFHTLPQWKGGDNAARSAGFELELAGVSMDACSRLIQEQFGGSIEPINSWEIEIKDTVCGKFRVELDSGWGKRLAAQLESQDENHSPEAHSFRQSVSNWLKKAAKQVVPVEIVTPPLASNQFERLEALREALHQLQAQGTHSHPLHAFGMHINPETPDESAETSHAILRAFLVLYPWLKQQHRIDPSRRILSFIDPFPERYVKKIVAQSSAPDWETFIAEYLEDNPTRNRALDLLPLFAHVQPEALEPLGESKRAQVKARPAYHYRLPNCDIDAPNWSIAEEWNGWVAVETLARDRTRLNELAGHFLDFLDDPFHGFNNEWVNYIERKTVG